MGHLMRSRRIAALTIATVTLCGCHSAFIDATISNRTSQPVSLIELDYPSATFGEQLLPSGGDFHYRFKVLGSGELHLTFTDADRHEHSSKGPALHEGDEGPITVTIAPDGVHWQLALLPHKG